MLRNRTIYLVLEALFELAVALITSINVVYLMSRDLSLVQVGLLTILFQVATLVLEVPTGALADTVGYRFSLVIGSTAGAISMAVYAVAHHIALFVGAEILFAIAMALYSGSLEAWIINAESASEATLPRILGAGSMAVRCANLIGAAVGGLAAIRTPVLPWLLSCVAFLLVALIAALFMNGGATRAQDEAPRGSTLANMAKSIQSGLGYIQGKRQLQALLVSVFFIEFSMIAVNLYWQPFFSQGRGYALLGPIGLGISLMTMLGTGASSFLSRLAENPRKVVVLAAVAMVIALGVAAMQITPWLTYTGIALLFLAVGFWGPAFRTVTNVLVTNEIRATLLSYQYMVGRIGSSAGAFALGWIADRQQIATTWTVAALVLALSVPFLGLATGFISVSDRITDHAKEVSSHKED